MVLVIEYESMLIICVSMKVFLVPANHRKLVYACFSMYIHINVNKRI